MLVLTYVAYITIPSYYSYIVTDAMIKLWFQVSFNGMDASIVY